MNIIKIKKNKKKKNIIIKSKWLNKKLINCNNKESLVCLSTDTSRKEIMIFLVIIKRPTRAKVKEGQDKEVRLVKSILGIIMIKLSHLMQLSTESDKGALIN